MNSPRLRDLPPISGRVTNDTIRKHQFLEAMYLDEYYPLNLVDQGREILLRLCEEIEENRPKIIRDLYSLTHATTLEFNALASVFLERGSEVETVARDAIGSDFDFIAKTYGYRANGEKLIAVRTW